MTDGNTKTIQKELKKIEVSLKKQSAYREAVLSSSALIERILKGLLNEQTKDEKIGLGKLLGLTRENKILPEELLTRLNTANDVRKKAAHHTVAPKKKDADEVYFTLVELISRTDKKGEFGGVCNACYGGWSRRGKGLCDKCYKDSTEIETVIRRIREKTNAKLKDIRELHELFPPAPIKLETINKVVDYKMGIPADVLKETGFPIKYVRYGKPVLGEPDRYFRQNKILNELHGELKQKVLEELQEGIEGDTTAIRYYEACVLLGREEWNEALIYPKWLFHPDDTARVDVSWFDKPKEEFEEIESLLNKRILEKLDSNTWLSAEDMTQTKMLDILIWLEIFFLVSTYHRQLLAKVAIARCGIERNSFLEHMTACSKEEFSKFLEAVSKIH